MVLLISTKKESLWEMKWNESWSLRTKWFFWKSDAKFFDIKSTYKDNSCRFYSLIRFLITVESNLIVWFLLWNFIGSLVEFDRFLHPNEPLNHWEPSKIEHTSTKDFFWKSPKWKKLLAIFNFFELILLHKNHSSWKSLASKDGIENSLTVLRCLTRHQKILLRGLLWI